LSGVAAEPIAETFPGFFDVRIDASPISLPDYQQKLPIDSGTLAISVSGISLQSEMLSSQAAEFALTYKVQGPEVPSGFSGGKLQKKRLTFELEAFLKTRENVPLTIPFPKQVPLRWQPGANPAFTLADRARTEKDLEMILDATLSDAYFSQHFAEVGFRNVPEAGKPFLAATIERSKGDLLAKARGQLKQQMKGAFLDQWLASITQKFSLPIRGSAPILVFLESDTTHPLHPTWRLRTELPDHFVERPLVQASTTGSRSSAITVSSEAMSFLLIDHLKNTSSAEDKADVYWLTLSDEAQRKEASQFFQRFEKSISADRTYRIGLSLSGDTAVQLRPWQWRTSQGTRTFLNLEASFTLIPQDDPLAAPERVDLQLRFLVDAAQGWQLVNVDAGSYTKLRALPEQKAVTSLLSVPAAISELKFMAANALVNAKLAEKTAKVQSGNVRVVGYECDIVDSARPDFGDSSFADALTVAFEIQP